MLHLDKADIAEDGSVEAYKIGKSSLNDIAYDCIKKSGWLDVMSDMTKERHGEYASYGADLFICTSQSKTGMDLLNTSKGRMMLTHRKYWHRDVYKYITYASGRKVYVIFLCKKLKFFKNAAAMFSNNESDVDFKRHREHGIIDNPLNDPWRYLNKLVLDGIDTSDVENMYRMFAGFDGEIEGIKDWDVSKAKDMACMFLNCGSSHIDIEKWDVSNVTDFSGMFKRTWAKELDISEWDMKSAIHLYGMFLETKSLVRGIGNINTENCTDLSYLLYRYGYPNIDVSGWKTSKVTDWSDTFNVDSSFPFQDELDISNLDFSKAKCLEYLFSHFKGNIKGLNKMDVSSADDFRSMFSYAEIPNLDTSNLHVKHCIHICGMFSSCKADVIDTGNFQFSYDEDEYRANNLFTDGSVFECCKANKIILSDAMVEFAKKKDTFRECEADVFDKDGNNINWIKGLYEHA